MLHVRRNAGGAVNIIAVVVFIIVLMSVDCFRVGGLSWRACSNSRINQDVRYSAMVGGCGFSKRENKTSTIR